MEQDIAVGLDIGTTKVCAIVASPDDNYPGKLKILGIGKSASEGLTRGVVTNIEKTVRSIQAAVQDAEQQSGVKIIYKAFKVAVSSVSAGRRMRSRRKMLTD